MATPCALASASRKAYARGRELLPAAATCSTARKATSAPVERSTTKQALFFSEAVAQSSSALPPAHLPAKTVSSTGSGAMMVGKPLGRLSAKA